MGALTVSLPDYLFVSAFLFAMGLFCVMGRRNAVSVLMGVELILNSANVNLVAFNYFLWSKGAPGSTAPDLSGHMFAIFVIVLAACEAAVFLAILMSLYQRVERIDVDEFKILQG